MKSKQKQKHKQTVAKSEIKLEEWLKRKSSHIFYLLFGVFIFFSFLYFNARASITGDDSTYITRALNLIQNGTFPSYQGPLYPMILSIFVGIFGTNLILLKISSTIFMCISFFVLYKSFKDKIPYTILFFTLAALSTSHYYLYFSSQTYSESLFILLQSLLVLVLYKNIDVKVNSFTFKSIKPFLIISLLCFALYLTRTVGIGALISIIAFYIVKKHFKQLTIVATSFIILFLAFAGIKSIFWDVPSQSGEQLTQLLNKHPYDSEQGKEDFTGFINRFKDNSNLYLSKHFMRFIGLRSSASQSTNGFITIILYILFTVGIIFFYNKKKEMLLIALYLAVMLGITFLSLQKLWDQYRLIIPFIPLMIIFLINTIWTFSVEKKYNLLLKALPFALSVSLFLIMSTGFKTIDLDTLSKNINGDKLAGFTDDYVNYITAVEYAAEKLQKDSYVACRKPNIARIYGKGKKFYGIYRIPGKDPDQLLGILKENKVTHIILASLRKNPYKNTGQSINTIKRYLHFIIKKHPNSLTLVRQFGKSEPAYLFKINYNSDLKKQNLQTN